MLAFNYSAAGASSTTGAASGATSAGVSAGASTVASTATASTTASTGAATSLASSFFQTREIRSPTLVRDFDSSSVFAPSRNLARADIGAFIEPSNFASNTSRDGRFASFVAQAASITSPSK
jgi:hypothetical protein